MKAVIKCAVQFAVFFSFAICIAIPSFAYDLNVTKTSDTNDGSCDVEDCSLREAIIFANSLAGVGDITIHVPTGRYFITIEGSNEDEGATGDFDITNSMTISGDGMDATIISGLGSFGVHDRVFHINTLYGTVNLEDLQINGGYVWPENIGNGGGVLITDGDIEVNLLRCYLYGNQAAAGGAIYKNSNSYSLLEKALYVTDSIIEKNTAHYGHGGGIFARYINLVIDRSTLTANETYKTPQRTFEGGGLFAHGGYTAIMNSTFYKNIAGASSEMYIGGGRVIIHSTIISAELNGESHNITFIGDSLFSAIYNNIIWGKCSNFVDTISGGNLGEESCLSDSGISDIVLDSGPLLLPLGDYGGPTPTAPPALGSLAIDTGIYSMGSISSPTTDQRGIDRPQSGNGDAISEYDIGSVERENFTDIFKRYIKDLRHMVSDQTIPEGIQKSLYRKVVGSEASYDKGKINPAIYKLDALNNEVEAQRENALTVTQANNISFLSTMAIAVLMDQE